MEIIPTDDQVIKNIPNISNIYNYSPEQGEQIEFSFCSPHRVNIKEKIPQTISEGNYSNHHLRPRALTLSAPIASIKFDAGNETEVDIEEDILGGLLVGEEGSVHTNIFTVLECDCDLGYESLNTLTSVEQTLEERKDMIQKVLHTAREIRSPPTIRGYSKQCVTPQQIFAKKGDTTPPHTPIHEVYKILYIYI